MSRKINLLLAIIATLIFSNAISAQEDGILSNSRIIPAPVISCPLGLNLTTTAGFIDNLAPPFEATFQSPGLASWTSNNSLLKKNFDDPSLNRYVAHSFLLSNYKPCNKKFCRARLLIRVCNKVENFGFPPEFLNDTIQVGTSTSNIFTPFIYNQFIWKFNEADQCKTVIIQIGSVINSLVYLDVLIGDSTKVDYMQLELYL